MWIEIKHKRGGSVFCNNLILVIQTMFFPRFPIPVSSCYHNIPQIPPQQHKPAINSEKLGLIVTVFPTS